MRRLTACLLISLCTFTGHAQSLFTFTNYTTANGIADNTVNSIVQDTRGFIWFGTGEGLSRFDGTSFKNYFAQKNSSTSLPGNHISCLYEYKPGHLIMISGGTVTCMNTFSQQFYHPGAFINKLCYFIRPTGNGNYCIGRTDSSFIIDNNLQLTDTLVPPLKSKGNVPFTVSLHDNYWIVGTAWEYFIYNSITQTYSPFIDGASLPFRDKTLMFHFFDKKNNWLYFSNYYGGLYRYSLEGHLLYNWKVREKPGDMQNGNIGFVDSKNDSTLWIGNAESGGLYILNARTLKLTQVLADNNSTSSLVSNSVIFHYTDHSKNEWLATTNGVSKINNSVGNIRLWKSELTGIDKNAVLLSLKKGTDNNIYQAVFGTNKAYTIHNDDNITLLNSQKLPNIWCMNTFGHEIIFTGSGTSITMYNPLTGQYRQTDFLKKYFPVSDIVILAFKHSNGDEWYSGNNGGGFVRVDAKDGSVHHYKKDGPRGTFSISYYVSYAEDKDGDLWFGVNKSSKLLHWNKKTNYFREISLDTVKGINSRNLAGIDEVVVDKENNIWIAFDGAGIVKYDPVKNSGLQYTIEDGLPTNYVYSLKFDNKNRLWAGTLKGLSCFLITENKFVNFTKEDGLGDDYFSERCIEFDVETNKLWVGSQTTLMRFDPDILLRNTSSALPVYIDRIAVNGKTYITDNFSDIIFTPLQNNIQFYFIGLDINNGKDVEYSYQLAGADKDWIYNNNITTASYANLASGNYSFRVRARIKGDNSWSSIKQPVHFTIQTPWHQTWWFTLLVIAAAVSAIFLIIKNYTGRQLEKKRAVMEKELAVEQERTRMARELHDGLGSMLSGIKHSFTALQQQLPLNAEQGTKFHSNIGKLNESILELRNISHSIHSDSLLKYGLEILLSEYCNNLNQTGSLQISFKALNTDQAKLNEEQSFHIYRIVQELLQNIINHSGAAKAIVQLSYNTSRLYITVEDNGKGFNIANAAVSKGIGLKNIETRVNILKGKMDLRTDPADGTSVLIEIPC